MPHLEPMHATVDALPPTVNHMYCAGRGGKRYLSDGARTWYETAVLSIRAQVGMKRLPHKTPLRLSIVVYGLPRTTDIDNIGKASVDAIAKALEFDDRWIDALHIERGPWKRGQAVRTVYCLEARHA